MDLIEKLESNGKEVINTGGVTLYKEMSFTKENSIIDYKVSRLSNTFSSVNSCFSKL